MNYVPIVVATDLEVYDLHTDSWWSLTEETVKTDMLTVCFSSPRAEACPPRLFMPSLIYWAVPVKHLHRDAPCARVDALCVVWGSADLLRSFTESLVLSCGFHKQTLDLHVQWEWHSARRSALKHAALYPSMITMILFTANNGPFYPHCVDSVLWNRFKTRLEMLSELTMRSWDVNQLNHS